MTESSDQINRYLNECLSGIPEDIASIIIDSLALLSGEPKLMHNLGPGTSYQQRLVLVRQAYMSLLLYLIEHQLGQLNLAQRLFINTGAIADRIVFEDEQGQRFTLELLDTQIYEALRQDMLDLDEESLPRWARSIYHCEDQYNAIALGILEPEGLNKKNLAKFRATRSLEQQDLSREQATTLNNTYYALLQQSQERFEQLEHTLSSYARYASHVKVVQAQLKQAKRYNHLLAQREASEDEQDELASMMQDPGNRHLGQDIQTYAEEVGELLNKVKQQAQEIDSQNHKLKDITAKLIRTGFQDIGSVRNRTDIIFDEETRRLIKNHVQTASNFAVSAVHKSAYKTAESSTRILLDIHTREISNPLQESYCTLKNLVKSFEKLARIHTNLFQVDEAGQLILPPVLIEPIRNYAEWSDGRFILGFVSGEPARYGTQYSFSPVDMAVLRLGAMYAFRERIFDYRGNRLEGNLMADYSARLESKTTVKWVGEEKKYKLVTIMHEVDNADRHQAIEDYMEFIFHAANDFPAPLNLSKRKLAVMLRYIQIETPVRTIALLLRYVADKDIEEAKKVLMFRAGYDRARAYELLDQACLQYGQSLPESHHFYTQHLLK